MLDALYFTMLKNLLEKGNFNNEQMNYILFLLESEIEEHFRLQRFEYEEKIKELENENKELVKSHNAMEIENEAVKRRMDALLRTNELLMQQLEQRDTTTHQTLEAIKTNLLIGQEVIHSIQSQTTNMIEYKESKTKYIT